MSLLMSFVLYLYFYGFIITLPEYGGDSVGRVCRTWNEHNEIMAFQCIMSAMRERDSNIREYT